MKRKSIAAVLVAAILVGAPALCEAALITMAVTGQVQGRFGGGNTAVGQRGTVALLASSVGLVSPRDPASGLPTGRLQPGFVEIAKYLDSTTPKLVRAQVTNENLTSVLIRFWRPTPVGALQNHFTITLTNAGIVSFASDASSAGSASTVKETLKLIWQRMEMKDEVTGIVTIVDWESPAY